MKIHWHAEYVGTKVQMPSARRIKFDTVKSITALIAEWDYQVRVQKCGSCGTRERVCVCIDHADWRRCEETRLANGDGRRANGHATAAATRSSHSLLAELNHITSLLLLLVRAVSTEARHVRTAAWRAQGRENHALD